MKKILSFSLVGIIIITIMNGCVTNKNKLELRKKSLDKIKVTFWAASVTPEREEFFKRFQKKVSKVYPNIELDFLGIPGDLSAYRQKVDVAIAAGKAPDITNDFRASLIQNGYYEDLTTYFDNWNEKYKINSELLKISKSYDQLQNKLYALPYSSQTWNLWIRKDLFIEKHVNFPSNWNDFFYAVEKLTDKKNNKYGLSIRGGAGSANTLEMLMYSYSGIKNYFTEEGKCTINNPLNVEFVERYLGCYNKFTEQNDLTKSWTEVVNSFQSGRTSMIIHNAGSGKSMSYAFNNDTSKFEAYKLPISLKGYILHPGLMTLGLSMSSKSEHKDAVWKVMSLYLSDEINTEYCKVYGEIPANMESANDDFFKDTQYMSLGISLENNPKVKFNDTPYYLPTYSDIQSQMDFEVQKVMCGQITAQEMLDKWASLLEKAKKDYNELTYKK